MNNANMPASPIPHEGVKSTFSNGCDNLDGLDTHSGLSKREYTAIKAMQGLLASYGQHDVELAQDMAHDACVFADALLKHLEGRPNE